MDPTTPPVEVAGLERLGIEGGWVTETVRDPFLVLSSYAAATSKLHLATGVAIAFARSPITTALSAHDYQRRAAGASPSGWGRR